MLFRDEKQHLNEVLSKLLMLLQYTPPLVWAKPCIFLYNPVCKGFSPLAWGKVEQSAFL